jgi:hypothetical protein
MSGHIAHAGEVRVLSPSAMHSSLEALAEAHRRQTGDDVKLAFETAPALVKKLSAGEAADVIIAPPATMEGIVNMGKAAPAGRFAGPGHFQHGGAQARHTGSGFRRLQPRLQRALRRAPDGEARPRR